MPVQTVQKVSITHDAIIDLVIARPQLNYREIAGIFGYTPEGIGIIVRSDAFKARLQARKEVLTDPLIKQTVEDRLTGLAHASIDILADKLATSADPKLALATLETSLRASGLGARNGQTMNTQFVVNLPGPAASSSSWQQAFAPRALTVDTDTIDAPRENA